MFWMQQHDWAGSGLCFLAGTFRVNAGNKLFTTLMTRCSCNCNDYTSTAVTAQYSVWILTICYTFCMLCLTEHKATAKSQVLLRPIMCPEIGMWCSSMSCYQSMLAIPLYGCNTITSCKSCPTPSFIKTIWHALRTETLLCWLRVRG